MIGYSERNVFGRYPGLLDVFEQAKGIVDMLPDQVEEDDQELRCHEVARVVHELLDRSRVGFGLVDGHYGNVDHTYLTTSLNGVVCVLDVYAVGRLPMVQLVHGENGLARMYSAGQARTDIRHNVILELVASIARKAI